MTFKSVIFRYYKEVLKLAGWIYGHLFANPFVSFPIFSFLIVSTFFNIYWGVGFQVNIILILLITLAYLMNGGIVRLVQIILVVLAVIFIPCYLVVKNDIRQRDLAKGLVSSVSSEIVVDVSNRTRQKNTYQNAWGKIKGGAKVYMQFPRYPEVKRGAQCNIVGDVKFADLNSDFGRYLQKNGSYLYIKVRRFVCDEDVKSGFYGLYRYKEWVISAVERSIGEPNASLLIGVMFGDDRVYTEEFQEKVRGAGLSHIVAASGYNIAFVSMIAEKLLFILRGWSKRVAILFVLFGYCFIAGLSASVLRAFFSYVFKFIFGKLGYPLPPLFNLGVVVSTMLLINPLYIYDIGFQLSVLATFGIVFIVPAIQSICRVSSSLMIPLVCAILVNPVSIANFGTASIISTVTNYITLGTLEYVMLSGFIFSIIYFVSPFLAKYFSYVIDLQFVVLNIVVDWFGGLWFAQLDIGLSLSVILVVGCLTLVFKIVSRNSNILL